MAEESGRPLSFSLVQTRGDGWRRQLELLAAANRDGIADDRAGGAACRRAPARAAVHPPSLAREPRLPARSPAFRSPNGSRSCATRASRPACSRRTPTGRNEPRNGSAAALLAGVRPACSVVADPPDYEPQPDVQHRDGRGDVPVASRWSWPTTCSSATTAGPAVPAAASTTATGNLDAAGRDAGATRTRSSGSATAARTSAPSATPASRRRCSPSGVVTATTAGSTSPSSCTARPRRPPVQSACSTAACSRPGYRADVNVIDFERLTARSPEMRYDLPAGGKRLVQTADGYVATIVAGTVTYEEGVATGPLPGRLLRGPQPAPDTELHLEDADEHDRHDDHGRPGRAGAARAGVRVAQRRSRRPVRLRAHRRAPRRARRRAGPRRSEHRRRARHHPRRCSRCRRSAPSWPASTHELINGAGVVLIRGLPAERYAKERASAIYWGVGTHLGQPVAAERQGPPARRRHRPGPGRRRPHRRAATRSAASRSRSTPTARTSSACSASTPAPAVVRASWRTRSRSTTSSSGPRPSWRPSSTLRSRTTCGASRRPARSPGTTMPIFTRCGRPPLRPLHPPVHRVGPAPRGRAPTVGRGA